MINDGGQDAGTVGSHGLSRATTTHSHSTTATTQTNTQTSSSSADSEILNDRPWSRKRRFSVGMVPERNTLMPSRTENGSVTTPYALGTP